MQLKSAIEKRKSVTKFSHKAPDWRKIIRAIDAARHGPSAGNQYTTKFILVSDKDKIKRLAEASQQSFIKDASYVVVAVNDETKLVRSYGEKGSKYAIQQASAAIQNFLLALTELKLVTKWVLYYYEEKVKSILEVPENMTIEGIFPIGRETKIKTHEEKKIDLENIIYFDEWKNKKMRPQTRVGVDSV